MKKGLALILATVLLVVAAVAGTMAWLTSKTNSITNTFTTSDITVTLEETKTDFKMVPGYTIDKDPTVTVESGSEACYLFVELKKSTDFDDFMTYEVADGWTALTGADGVYYRPVTTTTSDQTFSVLKNDKVTVLGTVTKAMMDAVDNQQNGKPTLTVTAYASQLYKDGSTEFTAAEAWANAAD